MEFQKRDHSGQSGIIQKSLIHYDHVLIVDIDRNGIVRKSIAVPIEFDPMASLIDDVAQAFHYVNSEPGDPVVVDCYTSNTQLVKFIQSIIIKMFEHATTKQVDNHFKFSVSTFEDKTILHSDRLHLSVGPVIKFDFCNLSKINGLILDIEEAEQNKLDIEKLLRDYTWVAIIVPQRKYEVKITYAETSALTGENIRTAFENFVDRIAAEENLTI